jgi:hypothetical protein
MRSNLKARLNALERQRWARPTPLPGAFEIHCVGGQSHVEGEPCSEHEACVFKATPISGRIRRQLIVEWYPGMGNPFELG